MGETMGFRNGVRLGVLNAPLASSRGLSPADGTFMSPSPERMAPPGARGKRALESKAARPLTVAPPGIIDDESEIPVIFVPVDGIMLGATEAGSPANPPPEVESHENGEETIAEEPMDSRLAPVLSVVPSIAEWLA